MGCLLFFVCTPITCIVDNFTAVFGLWIATKSRASEFKIKANKIQCIDSRDTHFVIEVFFGILYELKKNIIPSYLLVLFYDRLLPTDIRPQNTTTPFS